MAYSRDLAKAPVERLDQAIRQTTQQQRPTTGRRSLTPPALRPKPGVKP